MAGFYKCSLQIRTVVLVLASREKSHKNWVKKEKYNFFKLYALQRK